MLVTETAWGKRIKTDVLILGTGASGVGAALRAAELKADVLMVGQGRLESSGCLGGGNDHFMAALGTDEPNDTREAFVGFFMKSAFGYREAQLNQWFDAIKPCVKILEEVDTEFLIKDGKRYRSVGFGQPGAWWLHITNGTTIKRHLARRVRKSGVNILDDFHITRLFERGGHIMGCMGFNVLTREVYAIECKTAICSLGWHPQRLTNNSTGNPYNCWHMPYNTGSYFVLPMQIGASLVNIDISGRATLIPKGWGAPGMNGINNMGGKEINALGERFMFKYDPMGENGMRRNQVMGTWQEQVEGNGPPFYMDMTHFSDEDVHHLQYVLMPADKETYLDYCAARGIEFKKAPLEVEVSEMTGMLLADDRLETTVKGLFAGSNFTSFSGAMCCGYVAAFHAANDAASTEMGVIDDAEAQAEHDRILAPWERKGTNLLEYNDFEDPIRQIMDYYAKYRRNMAGMRLALEKLALVESYTDRVVATNNHELMRLHEAFDLLELCRAHLEACLQRKESGRGMYQLSDYPEKDPELAKGLVLTRKDGAFQFGWTE
jgi:succinate dehydrogenase/fumarate reductase flavoprotein subunit